MTSHPRRRRTWTGSTHRRRNRRPSAGSATATRCTSAARFVDGRGDDVKTDQPGDRGDARHGQHRRRRPTSTRGRRGPAPPTTVVWSRISAAERGKYLYRIARGIAERARELAVVETLDNGKPIKESRDVDVPTAAAHFFYHAGWADKLQHAGFGAAPAPLGVAGQVIPWNFPLLMAAWKIAPALAAGNTVVIKPAETTPLSILVLAEIIADADLPPGVVNIITGAGDIGAALVNHPGHRQGRLHRVHRGRPADPVRRWPAPAARSPSNWAARPRTSSSTTRRSTRPSRASSTASSSTRATSAARDPGCWCRNRSPTRSTRSSGPGSPRCGWATRWTRTPTSAPSTPPTQLATIRSLTDTGEAEGARALDLTVPGARPRLLLPADGVHPGLAVDADRPRRDLRAGAVGADLPHPGRGGREGQQHPVRPVRRRVDREGLAHPGDGVGAAGRRGLGEHLQPVRPDRGVRRLQGVRLRPGGRPVGAVGLPEHR